MQKTIEERILRLIGRLDGMTKRHPRPGCSPPPGMEPPPGGTLPPLPGPGMGRVLSLLNDCGETNQAALAKELDIRPQSLSELIGKLESDGLISRQQSPADRRQTIVSITDKGRERVTLFRERRRKEAEEFLAILSEEEKEQLYTLLRKLVDAHRDCPPKQEEPEKNEESQN